MHAIVAAQIRSVELLDNVRYGVERGGDSVVSGGSSALCSPKSMLFVSRCGEREDAKQPRQLFT